MNDISKHPLCKQVYELGLAIEKCGASPELTDASAKCSKLLGDLFSLLEFNGELTPITDKAAFDDTNPMGCNLDVVPADLARHFERQLNAMRKALAHIERACEPGINQSDDEIEMFIANVRSLAIATLRPKTL